MAAEIWVKISVDNIRTGAGTTWDGGNTIWDNGATIWDTEEVPTTVWEQISAS